MLKAHVRKWKSRNAFNGLERMLQSFRFSYIFTKKTETTFDKFDLMKSWVLQMNFWNICTIYFTWTLVKSLMKLLYILEYMLAQNLWRSSGYLLWNYFWLSSYSWKCIRSSNFSDFQEKAFLSSYLLKAHYYISAKGHNLHIRIKFCNYSKVMKCQTSLFSPHFCNMQ